MRRERDFDLAKTIEVHGPMRIQRELRDLSRKTYSSGSLFVPPPSLSFDRVQIPTQSLLLSTSCCCFSYALAGYWESVHLSDQTADRRGGELQQDEVIVNLA